ncbi:hypothetical protein AAVH_10913 [Aphelenchoides avenae]|nr:hypothetical protein AAVH_10913 [Aphelenchus avenae]
MGDPTPVSYFVINLVVGTFVTSANLAMLAVILYRRHLRSQKEYVVLGANMLLDAICGASFCLPAAERLSGQGAVALCTSGPIILAIALDRLCSVAFPFAYLRSTRTYSLGLVGAVFAASLPTMIGTLITADRSQKTISSECSFVLAIDRVSLKVVPWVNVATTVVAVFLYVPIIVRIYEIHYAKSEHARLSTIERRRIVRTTVTFSLIMVSHLGMFVVPFILDFFMQGSVFLVSLTLRNFKGAFDVVICMVMQREALRSVLPAHRIAAAPNRSDTNSWS